MKGESDASRDEEPADVRVGRVALEKLDVPNWLQRTVSLSHAIPWMHSDDHSWFEELQIWLAGVDTNSDSLVAASVSNLRRVVDDLLWLFDYDIDVRNDSYWVRKWYHRGLGGTGGWDEVERYELHVLLIQNVVAELVRAVNLILLRVRATGVQVAPGVGWVLVDTASQDAPYQPARYAQADETTPEPYPGLRAFPAVIPSRDYGALGTSGDEARAPAAFVEWIDELGIRKDSRPSRPSRAYPIELPLIGSKSASHRGDEAGVVNNVEDGDSHRLAGVIRPLRRVVRGIVRAVDLPNHKPLVNTIVGVVLAAIIAIVIVNPLNRPAQQESTPTSPKPSKPAGVPAASASPKPARTVPDLSLNPDAACSSIEGASTTAKAHMEFVDSTGILEGGGMAQGRVLPRGAYSDLVHAELKDRVGLSVKLFNTSYASADGVHVVLRWERQSVRCVRITGRAYSTSDPKNTAEFTPVLIVVPPHPARAIRPRAIPGSTILIDQHRKRLASLADGIGDGGIAIPYEIPPASNNIYFVNLELLL